MQRSGQMISNQILQNTIEGLKSITRIDLCIMDTDGKVLASTFSVRRGTRKRYVHLWIHRPTARLYQDTSFSRFMTTAALNMC